MRFDVDSSERTMRPFRFSFARSSSPARRLPAAISPISRTQISTQGRGSPRGCRRRRRRGPCRCTGSRSCRPSTPFPASRGSPGRAATTPSRRGSSRGARPRSGAGRSARCRGAEAEVVLLGVLALEPDARRRHAAERPVNVRAGARLCARAALGALQQGDEPVVVDAARRRDDDVAGPVHGAVVGAERAAADVRDHLRGADHRPPERVRAEDRLREQVVDQLLRGVLVHRDLLEHDLALGVDLGERRREDHVRHHLERRLDVPVGHPRVDDRVLARGGGVQLGAHRVERLRDLLRVVGAGALEE